MGCAHDAGDSPSNGDACALDLMLMDSFALDIAGCRLHAVPSRRGLATIWDIAHHGDPSSSHITSAPNGLRMPRTRGGFDWRPCCFPCAHTPTLVQLGRVMFWIASSWNGGEVGSEFGFLACTLGLNFIFCFTLTSLCPMRHTVSCVHRFVDLTFVIRRLETSSFSVLT